MKPVNATLIGYIGIFFWTMVAVFISALKQIPVFEILMITLGISSICILLKVGLRKEFHKLKQPLGLSLLGIVAVGGNEMLMVEAFQFAPPAQIDLILCLWPVLVVLLSVLLPDERLSIKHLVAVSLGFGAIIILFFDQGASAISGAYSAGYLLAFTAALLWAAYAVVSRFYAHVPVEMMGVFCGAGAILSTILHFSLEQTVMPTGKEIVLLVLMGFFIQGLSYIFWDYGIKNGNFRLLSVLSYGNPVLSVMFLVLFGFASLTLGLMIAVAMVTTAGIIAAKAK